MEETQMNNFSAMIKQWWAQPFNAQGSAVTWFLFFGLIIIIIIAWNMILKFIIAET